MLGDTIETIKRHYTLFVKELRERIRKALETGVGIGLRPPGAIPVPDSHTQQQTPASGSADFVALQTMSLVAGAGLAVFSLNQHITKWMWQGLSISRILCRALRRSSRR